MSYTYDVFFSYRHKPLDSQITEKLFNMVESYRLPETLRARGCQDVHRAFRDTEELAVSRILTDTIDKALHGTNCLIVVCSTDTPSSEWVDREVATFIELGKADRIFPLLITGDPETSFPPSLKRIPDIAARTMDIRVPGNPVKAMLAKAETELLKVIAVIAGCTEAELQREHKLRRNRRLVQRTAAAVTVLAAVSGVSFLLMNLARTYRETAYLHEQASMQILNRLTYELPDQLTNVTGAYGRIAELLQRNTEDINVIVRLSADKENAEYEAAANYEKLGHAYSVLGSYDDALAAEQKAVELFGVLAENGYAKGGPALVSAFSNRGNICHSAGRYEEAAQSYSDALQLMDQTDGMDEVTAAVICYNAGANAVSLGDAAGAADYFDRALAILDKAEETRETISAVAAASYNYGILLYRTGQYQAAEEKLAAAAGNYSRLLEQEDSLTGRMDYIRAVSMQAVCLMDEGRFAEADAAYAQAVSAAEELAEDRENMDSQQLLADLYNNQGLCFNIQGNYEAADRCYGLAAERYELISRKTGSDTAAAVYALALLNRGENAFKAGTYEESKVLFESGLQEYEKVYAALGDFHAAQYYAWRSYYDLIHLRDPEAARLAAREACRRQPDHVLANLNLAYAELYCGNYAECDRLFALIASLGEGQAETIRADLAAQQKAGLESSHIPDVLALIGG